LPSFRNATADRSHRDKRYGVYDPNARTVTVNAARCRLPAIEPVRMWSYPGYKVDRTPYGVVCHETGHHVHDTIKGGRSVLRELREAVKGEKPLSGYEPNIGEVFAEAMRLFLTNPDLLRLGRPQRYEFFLSLGLTPVLEDDWREVLRDAHPRIQQAAARWVA